MFQKLGSFFSKKTGYEKEFAEAVKNTNKQGLGSYKPYKKTNDRLITNESVAQFQNTVKHLNLTPNMLVAQCLGIHFLLKPYVDEFFGVDSTITVGHIDRKVGGKTFFEPFEQRLEYLRSPIDLKSPINIHVWLTLPTLEILDFTLPSTLAKAYNLKHLEGAIIGQHGDDDNDLFYKPEFVGQEFLYKSGFMQLGMFSM